MRTTITTSRPDLSMLMPIKVSFWRNECNRQRRVHPCKLLNWLQDMPTLRGGGIIHLQQNKNGECMTFEEVFNFENLYKASRKCRLGLRWKPSVQRYLANEVKFVADIHKRLHSNKYKALPFKEFTINERGKTRRIKSCHIRDRVVQKCLCDNCLIPLLTPKLIYDNSACMKYKGIHFARNRLECHLQKFHRKHKEGYVLLFDFKSYFDSIPHNKLVEMVGKVVEDERIMRLYSQLLDDMDKGLGLGSQISQISAVYYLNGLDHFIKERLQIKYYGRYMDDGYLIHENKEYLVECLNAILNYIKPLGVNLNPHKTQIVKISSGFNYLKQRWLLTDSGKIIRTVATNSIARQRRKLKKFKKKRLPKEYAKLSQQSWIASIEKINSKRQVYRMNLLYKELFGV